MYTKQLEMEKQRLSHLVLHIISASKLGLPLGETEAEHKPQMEKCS